MVNVSVDLYDVCLPDYCGGHHKPLLSVPVDHLTTRTELVGALLDELHQGVMDYQLEQLLEQDGLEELTSDRAYELLDAAIKAIDCNQTGALFPDLEQYLYCEANGNNVTVYDVRDNELAEYEGVLTAEQEDYDDAAAAWVCEHSDLAGVTLPYTDREYNDSVYAYFVVTIEG